jgi:DNA (cytosine-5)-methyltransferase 1
MKVLNLYAGIGGNRRLWRNCEVTAVENNAKIAAIYNDLYPKDIMYLEDAHEFLLENYAEYDFIWTSPPCPTHSSFRFNIGVRFRNVKPVYPDMTLYQEIILLSTHFKGKWVVENVKPYYDPLIKPTIQLQRHLFWTNFDIKEKAFVKDDLRNAQIPELQKLHNVDLTKYNISNKRQILRNCTRSDIGEYIYEQATKIH